MCNECPKLFVYCDIKLGSTYIRLSELAYVLIFEEKISLNCETLKITLKIYHFFSVRELKIKTKYWNFPHNLFSIKLNLRNIMLYEGSYSIIWLFSSLIRVPRFV